MLEDHFEKIHQDIDKFHRRDAWLKSPDARAFSFSHLEKTANDREVLAAHRERQQKRQCASRKPL
jgi:hypothetical protein